MRDMQLTNEQLVILLRLHKDGAVKRSAFDESALTDLFSAVLIRETPPDRVAITPRGIDAALPKLGARLDPPKPARAQAQGDNFKPLSEAQRDALQLIAEAGGEMEASRLDGRSVRALENARLVETTKGGKVAITAAGIKRLPKAAPSVAATVQVPAAHVEEAAAPGPEPDAEPEEAPVALASDAAAAPVEQPSGVPCAEGDDCATCRALQVLVSASPAVREAFLAALAHKQSESALNAALKALS